MSKVQDVGGHYVGLHAPVDMAQVEQHLAAVIRSRPVAQRLMANVFGASQYFDPVGVMRTLQLQLMQPERFGLSDRQLAALQSALAIGRLAVTQEEKHRVDHPTEGAGYFVNAMSWGNVEQMGILVLDVKHQVLGFEVFSVGTAVECLCHPREVFSHVLRMGGTRFIIGHNHPSGSLEPSPEDIILTRQMLKAAQLMGMPILDHYIVSHGQFQSLREGTNLWQELPQN